MLVATWSRCRSSSGGAAGCRPRRRIHDAAVECARSPSRNDDRHRPRPRPCRVRSLRVVGGRPASARCGRSRSTRRRRPRAAGDRPHMVGKRVDASQTWERAHAAALRAGDVRRAVRSAFQLIQNLAQRGELAQAGGWIARVTRLLDQLPDDCPERAIPLVPAALQARDSGDYDTALRLFEQVAATAARFNEPELSAMSRLGLGQALVDVGEIDRGVALLDEALVAVTAGDVSPINAGTVYCGSIEAFQQAFDFQRAQEWTTALDRWFARQPDAVPFRGRCLVFRAEILQFHGHWADAVEEVGRAHEWLLGPPIEPAIGEAYYHRAELHRLRGEFAEAVTDYREASTWGRQPDPGMAMLRLAQGDGAAAAAAIHRALDEADQTQRAEAPRRRSLDRACAWRCRRRPGPRRRACGTVGRRPPDAAARSDRHEGRRHRPTGRGRSEDRPADPPPRIRAVAGVGRALRGRTGPCSDRPGLSGGWRCRRRGARAGGGARCLRQARRGPGCRRRRRHLGGPAAGTGRAEPARGRGPPAPCGRRDEPGDRRDTRDQRADRRPPREQHLHEAGRRARAPPRRRSPTSTTSSDSPGTHRRAGANWVPPPMPCRRAAPTVVVAISRWPVASDSDFLHG